MRKYIKVNSKTNYVLSTSAKKTDAIDDFTIKLKSGSQSYYVICYDSTGVRNLYSLTFTVEKIQRNYFYLCFDEDALEQHAKTYYNKGNARFLNYWDYYKLLVSKTFPIGAGSYGGGTYDFKIENIIEPYTNTTNGSWDNYIEYPKDPTKEGYIFKGWNTTKHAYNTWFSGEKFFVAKWESI